VPLSPHMPPLEQTCGCSPLHCFAFAAHAMQLPPLQTLAQAAPMSCQAPLASHFWGWSPLHLSMPGAQTPVHPPDAQTNAQAVPMSCQVPVASHVCG